MTYLFILHPLVFVLVDPYSWGIMIGAKRYSLDGTGWQVHITLLCARLTVTIPTSP
jgi:hypothetical protein